MRDFWFVSVIVLIVWNTLYAYRAIWDLNKCEDKIATISNNLDLILVYILACNFAGVSVLTKSSLTFVYILFFIINELSFMFKVSEYRYFRFNTLKEKEE